MSIRTTNEEAAALAAAGNERIEFVWRGNPTVRCVTGPDLADLREGLTENPSVDTAWYGKPNAAGTKLRTFGSILRTTEYNGYGLPS